jgi:hypothetical protein
LLDGVDFGHLLRAFSGEPDFYEKYQSWIDKNREFYNTNQKILKPWLDTSRKNSFWVGGSYRLNDAVSGLIGIILKEKFTIAYAYDFSVSKIVELLEKQFGATLRN